jgi:hypothetical protein
MNHIYEASLLQYVEARSEISESERTSIEEHLSVCPRCRVNLEIITEGEAVLRRRDIRLIDGNAFSRFWRSIKARVAHTKPVRKDAETNRSPGFPSSRILVAANSSSTRRRMQTVLIVRGPNGIEECEVEAGVTWATEAGPVLILDVLIGDPECVRDLRDCSVSAELSKGDEVVSLPLTPFTEKDEIPNMELTAVLKAQVPTEVTEKWTEWSRKVYINRPPAH